MKHLLAEHSFILAEAAITERLRHFDGVVLHPLLFNAPLIYEKRAGEMMAGIYRQYIEIARAAAVPILLTAPTWRLDPLRVAKAGVAATINRDAVAYMREIQAAAKYQATRVGGLLGPRNDCYSPELALSADQAAEFHAPQAMELAASGVDYLLAQTIPALSEALGLGRAMVSTGVPSIISFCINRHGQVLDGCPLDEAIERMDEALDFAPLGYMVNCSHPRFLDAGSMRPSSLGRLIGFDGNASSKDHCDLEGSSSTEQDSLEDWAAAMLALNRDFGVKILGGCCGSDDSYLRALTAGHGLNSGSGGAAMD